MVELQRHRLERLPAVVAVPDAVAAAELVVPVSPAHRVPAAVIPTRAAIRLRAQADSRLPVPVPVVEPAAVVDAAAVDVAVAAALHRPQVRARCSVIRPTRTISCCPASSSAATT